MTTSVGLNIVPLLPAAAMSLFANIPTRHVVAGQPARGCLIQPQTGKVLTRGGPPWVGQTAAFGLFTIAVERIESSGRIRCVHNGGLRSAPGEWRRSPQSEPGHRRSRTIRATSR